MANTELDVLKSRLDELKESMSAIRSKAASICGAIDSDALIPAVVAEELTAAISDYQQKEEQIRAIGDSLSIPIGATISEISESIRTREESLHLDRFRDIVLDYFRLNADAAELKSVLESTKLALIEKCTAPVSDIAEELAPYELVVSSVKGEKGPLSFKDSAPIRKNISDEIAYAVVSRELFFDDSIELAKYADGSCPLLTIPVDPAVVQEEVAVPEQNAEPANAGAVEEPTEAHSTDRRRWPDFGGYLSDGDSVSFTDNMATAQIDEVRRLDHALDEMIRSNCEKGVLADIQKPDKNLLSDIIKTKAFAAGVLLSAEQFRLVESFHFENIRQVEGFIRYLSAHVMSGREVKVSAIEEAASIMQLVHS